MSCAFFFILLSLLCFFLSFSFWRYAVNPNRTAFDNLSGDSNLVSTTNNHRPSKNSVRCALQLHCQTGSWLLSSCSTIPAISTEGPDRLEETSFSFARCCCFLSSSVFAQQEDCEERQEQPNCLNSIFAHAIAQVGNWMYRIYKQIKHRRVLTVPECLESSERWDMCAMYSFVIARTVRK